MCASRFWALPARLPARPVCSDTCERMRSICLEFSEILTCAMPAAPTKPAGALVATKPGSSAAKPMAAMMPMHRPCSVQPASQTSRNQWWCTTNQAPVTVAPTANRL